jgi:hypothetical protein
MEGIIPGYPGDIHVRLQLNAWLLETIDISRQRTGDPGLKLSLERDVIDRELDELAAEWKTSVLWGE